MTDAPAISAALRERYCAPEWALFFEVANGTGSNIRRYADALAMNLFPSRGLTLHGFEVKISRGDWQRELKNPQKAEESVFRYCDYWWVVAFPDVVAKADLPPTWGLIEMQKASLRQIVAAPQLSPVEMSRSFIAALLRRASEVDQRMVDALVEKKYADRRASIEAEVDRRVKSRLRDVEEKLGRVAKIELAAGISLTDWSADEGMGRAIKAIEAAGLTKSWSGLRSLQSSLKRIHDDLSGHLAEFDALAPEAE